MITDSAIAYDWDKIIEQAGMDNEPSRSIASTRALQKQAIALHDLSSHVFNAQKHLSQRLDTLNEELSKSSRSQSKLSRQTLRLTSALVIATIVQAIAAVLIVLKS